MQPQTRYSRASRSVNCETPQKSARQTEAPASHRSVAGRSTLTGERTWAGSVHSSEGSSAEAIPVSTPCA